jgi:hypothetical protein
LGELLIEDWSFVLQNEWISNSAAAQLFSGLSGLWFDRKIAAFYFRLYILFAFRFSEIITHLNIHPSVERRTPLSIVGHPFYRAIYRLWLAVILPLVSTNSTRAVGNHNITRAHTHHQPNTPSAIVLKRKRFLQIVRSDS